MLSAPVKEFEQITYQYIEQSNGNGTMLFRIGLL
jgi:hypothetical protein